METPERNDVKLGTVVVLSTLKNPIDLLVRRSKDKVTTAAILEIENMQYMGCSDVSEFEHIYGQRVTTPSCVYDR